MNYSLSNRVHLKVLLLLLQSADISCLLIRVYIYIWVPAKLLFTSYCGYCDIVHVDFCFLFVFLIKEQILNTYSIHTNQKSMIMV